MSESDSWIEVLEKERQDCLERVECIKLEIERIKTKMAENRKERAKLADEVLKLEELRKRALQREALGKKLEETFGNDPADLELASSIFDVFSDYFDDKVTFDEAYDFLQETFPKFSQSCPLANQVSKAKHENTGVE